MSLFRSLGRRAERVKRNFADDTRYGCRSCEEVLDEDYETCPRCGSDTVVPME